MKSSLTNIWLSTSLHKKSKHHPKQWLFSCLLVTALPGFSQLSETTLIERVRQHFPAILAEQHQLSAAQAEHFSQRGIFDPYIAGDVQYTPKGGYEHRYMANKLNIPIENTALKTFGGYRIGRGSWPIYYQNYLTNRYGETLVGLSLPLLRDRATDPGRTKLAQLAIDVDKQNIMLTLVSNQIINEALDAYYDWIAAGMQLQVYENMLNIAIKRQDALKAQIDVGDAARIDIVENNRFITQRKARLNLAQQNYKIHTRRLSLYYRDQTGKPVILHRRSLPTLSTHLSQEKISKTGLDMIKHQQPSLQLMFREISQLQLQRKLMLNQRLPQLNSELYVDKDHGVGNPALEKTSLKLGLSYQIPVRQRRVDGQLAAIRAKEDALKQKIRLFQQQLRIQLMNFITQVNTSIDVYHLSLKENTLAKELVTAEKKKFFMGDSSLFLVNEREQTENESRLNAIAGFIDYYRQRNQIRAFCLYRPDCFNKFHG